MPNPQPKSPPSSCSPTEQQAKSLVASTKLSQAGGIEAVESLGKGAQNKLNKCSKTKTLKLSQDSSKSKLVSVHLPGIKTNLAPEVSPKAVWEKSAKLANEAAQLESSPQSSDRTLQKVKSLWQESLDLLEQIPPNSELGKQAAEQIKKSKRSLVDVTYRLEVAKSDFLGPIAQRSGLSSQAKITVCHLTSHICRRLRGRELPRDVASLIKLPVAVALMHKLTTEKIRFDTPIYVDPGNFTEDASEIQVGQKYPLQKLLKEMIDRSSNIATNQLIDYLGWDYINKVLQERGFAITRVNFKVVGDRIWPRNPGSSRNSLTSDELTEMMMQIYNRKHLGDETLILALEGQYDRAMGFAAVDGSNAKWLGEKTGQTSRVLGTTLAINLFGDTYIITVIDDGMYSELTIRRFIAELANYIFQSGQL